MALTIISGVGSVAVQYGLDEAVFLDTIMHWVRSNRAHGKNGRDGRWWTYNPVRKWAETFPWWTEKQMRRIIDSCKEQGALLSACYNDDGRDRTVWYSPSDALLALYDEDWSRDWSQDCICPNGQMQLPKRANASAQMGRPLPCNYNHVDNIPPYNPPTGEEAAEIKTAKAPAPQQGEQAALFDRFWAAYPKKVGKQAARRAWKKLRPGKDTLQAMGEALAHQKRSAEWAKGGGAYIPNPATWLNARRWEDDPAAYHPAQSAGAPPEARSGPHVPAYVRTEIDPVTGRERDVYE